MAFEKITEEDLKGKGVVGLPDIPQLTTAEMQGKFEEVSMAVIIPKLNKLIDDLMANTAGESIGVKVPEGLTSEENVQALLNEISTIALASKSVNTLLGEIKSISNTVSDDATALATCKAVYDYVVQMGGGDMMKSTYDTNGNGIVDDTEKLGGKEASAYAEVSDLTDTVPYNLIPFPYYEGSHTDNGIEWTVDNTAGLIMANGTALDGDCVLRVMSKNLPSGQYTLSGCPTGGSSSTYRFRVGTGEDEAYFKVETGNGVTFSLTEETKVTIMAQLFKGYTAENLTFKPMLVKGDTAKEFRKNFKSVYEMQQYLTATLTAGETSLTISDASITEDSMIDIYTNVFGVNPTEVTVANGSITFVFDAQETDLGVKVRVM